IWERIWICLCLGVGRGGRGWVGARVWLSHPVSCAEVSVGGSVSIQCLGLRPGVRFVLNKGGRHAAHVDTDKSQFVFPINNVQWEQGGNYSCSHHSRSEPFTEWSDPVELVVRGEGYPKPNISGIPSRVVSLGAAVTIRCEGQHQGMRFLLNKEGRHFPPVDSGGFVAEFLIRNVSREDGGSYNCSYHSRSEPFNVSYPSDPMELVVRGEGPSSVSPFPASHPARPSGAQCQWTLRAKVCPDDRAGICLTACLLLPAEFRYPKPNISLRPSGGVAQGEAVTIRCECQCLGVRFLLRKDGAMAGHHTTDPALDVVEFPIRNVSQGDAGSYSCRYRTKWDPLVWSEPSHSVELVVAGEGSGLASLLPAPHPAGPSGGLRASLGCWYYPAPASPPSADSPAERFRNKAPPSLGCCPVGH
uniref:Ig-like domain-containing protein n=1 Tax=Chelonoidis abingdonii TaxID=106734 RepID=A0A8C0H6V2_CHEAB